MRPAPPHTRVFPPWRPGWKTPRWAIRCTSDTQSGIGRKQVIGTPAGNGRRSGALSAFMGHHKREEAGACRTVESVKSSQRTLRRSSGSAGGCDRTFAMSKPLHSATQHAERASERRTRGCRPLASRSPRTAGRLAGRGLCQEDQSTVSVPPDAVAGRSQGGTGVSALPLARARLLALPHPADARGSALPRLDIAPLWA